MSRYIIPIFLTIIASAMYVVYLDATYQQIQVQLAKEQELLTYLADAKDARDKLDKIAAEYEAFPANADERLNVMLPDTIDPVKLIVDVNDVVEKHGMIAKNPSVSMESEDPKNPGKYRKSTISFGVSATYPGFRTFLRALESSLALRDFSDVSFTANASASGAGPAQVRPEFVVYEYTVIVSSYSLK